MEILRVSCNTVADLTEDEVFGVDVALTGVNEVNSKTGSCLFAECPLKRVCQTRGNEVILQEESKDNYRVFVCKV
ncbi:MAG TPA: hypothetical protein VF828_02050 [Patescibacteria group bacterium]